MDTPDWAKEALPEELQSAPFLKDTENLEQFKERLSSAAEHMGNSMRIPGPDATQEVWDEFKGKLQEKVPDLHRMDFSSPEGRLEAMIKMGLPTEATEYGAEGDGSWLAEVAHNAALTKDQFEALVKGVGERNINSKQEMTAEQHEALEKLDLEWGLSAPKNYDMIEGLLRLTKAPEQLAEQLNDKSLDVNTIQWLHGIASQFADAANFVKDRNDPNQISPVEAQQQINELLNNPDYYDQGAIGRDLRKRMLQLQAAASPGASSSLEDLRSNTELGGILDQFGT